MAKNNKLSFGQLPLPNDSKTYRSVKYSWSGLNKRQTTDTGALSSEQNISTAEAPYIVPSQSRQKLNIPNGDYPTAKAFFSLDDKLYVVYSKNSQILIDCIIANESIAKKVYTGLVAEYDDEETAVEKSNCIHSAVQFNTYSNAVSVTDGYYTRKIVLLPYKKTMYLDIKEFKKTADTDTPNKMDNAVKNVMYCRIDDNTKTYYTWDFTQNTFTKCGTDIFELSNLDVDVTTFYNDGYKLTTDKTYDDTKTYYKRTASLNGAQYEYTEVENLAKGDNVSKFYVQTDDYTPQDTGKENEYRFNTYNNMCYTYMVYDDGTKKWIICSNISFPNIKYATVHCSRLFGVSTDKVYASGFNDYANWNYDTATDENANNAWCSTAQSDAQSDGEFMGICTYDNHVICFKRDYMQEIYNNKNPFRIIGIYAEGCIDNRSIQEVGGQLIFVSKNGIMVYTGGKPRNIGYNLGIDNFKKAVAGSDGKNYYLYCEYENSGKGFFVYDTLTGQWSERDLAANKDGSVSVLGFASAKNDMYALADGVIYRLSTEQYEHNWYFETDLSTYISSSPTYEIKHIRKINTAAYIKKGAYFSIYAIYDNNDTEQCLFSCKADEYQDVTIPIRIKPRQTANYAYKLRFEGYGYVRIYNLELFLTQGGELYV